jgi:hypothetical protein
MRDLDLLNRLRLVRQHLSAFHSEAARKTGNPEFEALKAEEADAVQALEDAGLCPECGSGQHTGRSCAA